VTAVHSERMLWDFEAACPPGGRASPTMLPRLSRQVHTRMHSWLRVQPWTAQMRCWQAGHRMPLPSCGRQVTTPSRKLPWGSACSITLQSQRGLHLKKESGKR